MSFYQWFKLFRLYQNGKWAAVFKALLIALGARVHISQPPKAKRITPHKILPRFQATANSSSPCATQSMPMNGGRMTSRSGPVVRITPSVWLWMQPATTARW